MGNQTATRAISPEEDSSTDRAAIRRILICMLERLEAVTADVIRLADAVEKDPGGVMQLEAEMKEYYY